MDRWSRSIKRGVIGGVIGLGITFLVCAVGAALIVSGTLEIHAEGYLTLGCRLLSAWAAAGAGGNGGQTLGAAVGALAYMMLLLILAAGFFQIHMDALAVYIPVILCGWGIWFLLIAFRKRRGRRRNIRRKR